MNALTIKNGQFIDSTGNIIKPEFGNREQISILRKYQKEQELIERAEHEGIDIDFKVQETEEVTTYYLRIDASFTCICGKDINEKGVGDREEEGSYDDSDVIESFIFGGDIEGHKFHCKSCQRNYEVKNVDGKFKSVELI